MYFLIYFCVHVYMLWYACGNQRTTCWIQFSLSMWVQGSNSGCQSWGQAPDLLSHLTVPCQVFLGGGSGFKIRVQQ